MFGYNTALVLAGTIVIPGFIGLLYFNKLTKPFKLLVILLTFGLATELTLFSLPYFGINSFFGIHLYGVVEIVLLSLTFWYLVKSHRARQVIRVMMYIGASFALFYSAIDNNITEFNSIPRAIECMYFTALSCYLFYEMSLEPDNNDSLYFVNGAVFFYFSACFMVFAFSKYHREDADLLLMHNVHSIVSTISNFSYAVGLWLASKLSYSAA
jgi:hypothetical protein